MSAELTGTEYASARAQRGAPSLMNDLDFCDPQMTLDVLDELHERGVTRMHFEQLHHLANGASLSGRRKYSGRILSAPTELFLSGGENERTARLSASPS